MTTLTASPMLPFASARTQGLRALFARMARAAEIRSARRELRSLDDHLLRDLGLTRDDIATLDV